MKFSIVVPSFNQGQFIGECLDSILLQKGDFDLECFVLDNHSKDKTWGTVTNRLSRPRPTNVHFTARQNTDLGQADAVNRGFNQSTGDIVSFLNSDDVLLPGCLESVRKAFQSHPEIDFIYGQAHFINAESKVIGDYKTFSFDEYPLCSHCVVSQPALFMRRSAFAKNGPFSLSIKNSFDYEYWLRAQSKGLKFLHIKTFLAATRLHNETKSFRNRKQIHSENFLIQMQYCGGISDEIMHQYLLESSPVQKVFKLLSLERLKLAVFLRRVESTLRRPRLRRKALEQLEQSQSNSHQQAVPESNS